MDTIPTAGIGHNRPPSLRDELVERNSAVVARANSLLDAAEALPTKVESDVEAATLADFSAQCRVALKALEEAHKVEKAPWLENGTTVDTYFRGPRTDLEAIIKRIQAACQTFANQKVSAERERQRLADEARRAAAPPDVPPLDAKAATPVARVRGQVGSMSARPEWQHRITALDKIDLNKLRKWIPTDTIVTALNHAVKAGLREIDGVEIYEGVKVRV